MVADFFHMYLNNFSGKSNWLEILGKVLSYKSILDDTQRSYVSIFPVIYLIFKKNY